MYLLSFLLLLSNSFLCLWFLTIYNVFWCRSIWVSPIWDLLGLMDLDIHFSAQLWKIFSNYQFKYTFYLSLFLISFWNSRKVNIFLFIVCPKSHRFFSTLLMLFLFFPPSGYFKCPLFLVTDFFFFCMAWSDFEVLHWNLLFNYYIFQT